MELIVLCLNFENSSFAAKSIITTEIVHRFVVLETRFAVIRFFVTALKAFMIGFSPSLDCSFAGIASTVEGFARVATIAMKKCFATSLGQCFIGIIDFVESLVKVTKFATFAKFIKLKTKDSSCY